MLRVTSMTSPKGNPVPNQFILTTDLGEFFQSYDSLIAFVEKGWTGKVLLDKKYYNYSRTTVKYRNQFLDMTTKEIEQKIKDGVILLVDLNKEGVK